LRISIYIGTSLDGFIADSNGGLNWLDAFADEEALQAYEEFLRSVDVHVIGRGTFEKVSTFPEWPYRKPVFLLSSTVKHLPGSYNEKIILLSMKPNELLKYLSEKGYASINIDGGKVIQSFLKEDAVETMILSKVPLLLGSGTPLFVNGGALLRFRHIRTRVFSSGLVQSHYERLKRKTTVYG
jgi:dihydrofolate reductase